MSNIEQAVKDLQDTLIVIAEIEKRQSAMLREHSERIVRLPPHRTESRRDHGQTEPPDRLRWRDEPSAISIERFRAQPPRRSTL